MEYKKELIVFLGKELEETLKITLRNEAELRVLEGMVLYNNKPNDEFMNAKIKTQQTKTYLESKVRQLRNIIKEVDENRLVI